MVCLDTSLSQMLTFAFWNDRAALITAAIAFAALIYTARQLKQNKIESRRNLSHTIYQNYLNLCFSNAELAYGNQEEIDGNPELKKKYPWFIAQMLFTFEQILDNGETDDKWNIAIAVQLKRHSWYLKKSKSVKCNEWNDKLQIKINQSIS